MVVISEDLRLEGHRVEVILYGAQRRTQAYGFLRLSFFVSFVVFLFCSQVRARAVTIPTAQLSRADSLKAVVRLCSLLIMIEVSDALVM